MSKNYLKMSMYAVLLVLLSGCGSPEPLSPEMQKLQTKYNAMPRDPQLTQPTVAIPVKPITLSNIYDNDQSRYWATYDLIEQALQETLKELKIDSSIRTVQIEKFNYATGNNKLLIKIHLTESSYPLRLGGVYKGLTFDLAYPDGNVAITVKDIYSSLFYENSKRAQKNKKITVENDMRKLINSYEQFDQVFIEKLKAAQFSHKINTATIRKVSIVYDGNKELFKDVHNRIVKKYNSVYIGNRDPESIWKAHKSYTSFKIKNTKVVLFLDNVDLSMSKKGTIVTFDTLLYGPIDDAITMKELETKLSDVYKNEQNDLTEYPLLDDQLMNNISLDIDPIKPNYGFMNMI